MYTWLGDCGDRSSTRRGLDDRAVYLELDPVALGEHAVANRMEMLELELQLAIDAATIDLEKNSALPLFTVDYSYSVFGIMID